MVKNGMKLDLNTNSPKYGNKSLVTKEQYFGKNLPR